MLVGLFEVNLNNIGKVLIEIISENLEVLWAKW